MTDFTRNTDTGSASASSGEPSGVFRPGRPPLVINLLGGPGAGKSTLAALLFGELRTRGASAELVAEFPKDLIWQGRHRDVSNQIMVLGEQWHRVERLAGKVDIVVTDSPTLLSAIYLPKSMPAELGNVALWCHRMFPSLNVFVQRPPAARYENGGRLHDEAAALRYDALILEACERFEVTPLLTAAPSHDWATRLADEALDRLEVLAAGESGSGDAASTDAGSRGAGAVRPLELVRR